MENYRVIEIKQSVFADNDQDANRLRQELKENKTFLLNLMSSPGSGKTTTLKQTISRMKNKYRMAVMEADIDSDVDAAAIADTGIRTIQLHTGGMCHLDADMTRQGLRSMGIQNVDIAILENVGNLVCPAEFDTGAVKNAMILSVPEGHDKPLKYPLIFQVCDALIINKIDVLPYFDFDLEKVISYAHMRNPELKIFPISAKTGEGVDTWCISQCSVKHIVDIQVNGVVNPAVHFLEQSVLFDVLAIAGIKVIQIAVEDTGISKGFLHVRSAFLALNHNKEMCIWQ